MLKKLLKRTARACGVEIKRAGDECGLRLPDLSPEIQSIVRRARPFTMTSPERLAAICLAVQNANENGIPGAFVECGVWKGGSSMTAAWMYRLLGRTDIDLYLFDTFEGMPQPTEHDLRAATGERASDLLMHSNKDGEIWAYSSLAEVQQNLARTEFPAARLHFIRGRVEDTIPHQAPEQISILRLDTDWYESTRHELFHLFPRLSAHGILIIDDYGDWTGARKAVDEFFAMSQFKPLLARIDQTGRICTKL